MSDSILEAAEQLGGIAAIALSQRDEAREALAAQIEIAQTWAARAVQLDCDLWILRDILKDALTLLARYDRKAARVMSELAGEA